MLESLFKRKLTKRILSALVLIPVSVGAIWAGGVVFLVFVSLAAGMAFHEWGQLSLKTERKLAFLLGGIFYVSIAFYSCYLIRMNFPLSIALLFVVMIWLSDISAYFVGKTIGGPKMAGAISPNKTWAGMGGAIAGPALVCLIFLVFAPSLSINGQDVLISVILGAVVGLVGQAGDLTVSFLKRSAGAKDSGQLIPGHGGLLDRVDSMMLVAPVYLLIITKFAHVFTS